MYTDSTGIKHRDIPWGLAWDDFETQRQEREDRPVRIRFAPYANLGIGHLRQDLCRVRMDY